MRRRGRTFGDGYFHGTSFLLADGVCFPTTQSRAGRPRSEEQPRTKVGSRASCPRTARSAVPPRDERPAAKALVPSLSAPRRAGVEASMEQILSFQMGSAFRWPNRGREPKVRYALGPGVDRWPGRNAGIERGSPERGRDASSRSSFEAIPSARGHNEPTRTSGSRSRPRTARSAVPHVMDVPQAKRLFPGSRPPGHRVGNFDEQPISSFYHFPTYSFYSAPGIWEPSSGSVQTSGAGIPPSQRRAAQAGTPLEIHASRESRPSGKGDFRARCWHTPKFRGGNLPRQFERLPLSPAPRRPYGFPQSQPTESGPCPSTKATTRPPSACCATPT